MHAKMALFRNFSRLQKFQQLYELYATRGDTISLLPLENVAKRHVIKSPWRGIVTVPNKYQLSSLSNSVTCTPPYFASYRGFHTPSSSLLSSREGKNQQKVTKNPQKSDEHGSVLNELMSVKQEAQPTQLTVGAKGDNFQSSIVYTCALYILPSLPYFSMQWYKQGEISHTYWWY